MFGINKRKTDRIKGIVEGSAVEYNAELKQFKLTLSIPSLSPEHFKRISKIGLEVDEIVNFDNGQWSVNLKSKSAKAKIIIGVLSLQVWLFALTIFTLLSKTNFQ